MSIQNCINTLVSRLAADTAVISPGSRNAPVIYALGKSGKTCHSIIDERSAAFVALGIAKQTRKAVILSCTSGTAALNYYPAIAEAYYARVPLIILTADRPSGKIDAWDGQAIRQNKMYSAHVRAEFQTPEDYSDVSVFREIAAEANSIVENNILGPIHINVPIREPFYNFSDEMIEEGRYVLSEPNSHKVQISSIPQLLNIDLSKKKVLIFNGMDDGENIEVESDDAAVVLSDITSRKKSNIDYWDALLFSAQCKTEGLQYLSVLKPDIVISTGTTTVSKGIKRFLQSHKPEIHVHLSKYDEVGDMFETNPKLVNPKELNKVSDASLSLHQGYVSAWQDLTKELRMNFEHLDWSLFNEFSAVNYILSKIPDGEILHLSNSMPVRYASFLLNGELSNKVYCNRGTSGIDGSTSTAVGAAMVAEESVYLITGDVAFLYDVNGMFNENLPKNLKVIILNNHQGGIFEMISGPEKMGKALQYQTTPHDYSARHLASHFGLEYWRGEDFRSLVVGFEALRMAKGPGILELSTSPEQNRDFFEKFKNL